MGENDFSDGKMLLIKITNKTDAHEILRTIEDSQDVDKNKKQANKIYSVTNNYYKIISETILGNILD